MMVCPKCEHENYERGLNMVKHKSLPVFDPQMFAQQSGTCEKCECEFGTGDIDIIDFNE